MAALCDLQFDQVTLAGSHNAGSGFDGDLIYPSGEVAPPCLVRNQNFDMAAQLDIGVRALEFDPCYVEECAGSLCPEGVWTCHGNAYAGPLEKALRQIDDWMKSHPNEVCAVAINDDYPEEYQEQIRDGVHALLASLWEPTLERTNRSDLTMSTHRAMSGQWPTLLEAIETNQRVFVFVEPELQKQPEEWLYPLPTSTFGTTVLNSESACEQVVFYAEDRCNLCDEMVKVSTHPPKTKKIVIVLSN